MLQSLHIINFAIIKDTVLDPASGVTICTGETGSGKSIVIDALAVLMGRRAKTDFIRTGADYFKIEGVFYVDDTIIEDLQKEGIDTDGNQLILSRRLNRNGRGICTINGNFCTVRQLQSLGSKLVRLHEQNDNMELLSIPFCERMVDTGTPDVIASYKKYRELYEEWKKLKDDLDDYKLRKQERERRLDTLEWELNQINAANLHEGEDEEVTSKLNILQNHEKILRALQGEVRGQTIKEPIMTVDGSNRYGLVTSFLHKYYDGGYKGAGDSVEKPLPTVTAWDHNSVVTANLIQMNNHCDGRDLRDPIPTITAGDGHFGEVRAFLIKYYGQGTGQDIEEPLDTVTSRDRFGLVTIEGVDYQIVDIGLRMLEPKELYGCQGFPEDYIIDHDYTGKTYPRSEQVRRCGNAVCPPIPAALEIGRAHV